MQKQIPVLKIQGQWLREIGFTAGAKLKIEARKGVITIKVDPPVKFPLATGRPGVTYHPMSRITPTRFFYAKVEAEAH